MTTFLPPTHTAGDTFTHTLADARYPASAGWGATLYVVPRVGGSVSNHAGTASGDAHVLTVPAATTAAWAVGWVSMFVAMSRSGERATVHLGQLQVLANPVTLTVAVDTRSLAQRTLDDLFAARAAWATSHGTTRRYKVGDREREFASAAELEQEIQFWQRQVRDEQTAARLAAGAPARNRILTRFVRPR